MNILKILKKLINKNLYIEHQIENADIIIAGNEKLNREQIKERFDNYYKSKDIKSWDNAHKRTI